MTKQEAIKVLNQMNSLIGENFPNFECKMSVKRFGDSTVSFKMELIEEAKLDEINERENEIGLRKNGCYINIIGMKFNNNTHGYVVESVKPRKQKYPVLCRRVSDGKLYKFASQFINDKYSEMLNS